MSLEAYLMKDQAGAHLQIDDSQPIIQLGVRLLLSYQTEKPQKGNFLNTDSIL